MSAMITITSKGFYLTSRQIAEQLDWSRRTVKNIMNEMEDFIGKRYSPQDILEDSRMIHQYALYDFLKYRKALKNGLRVPAFDREKWAQECPILERWMIEN